MSCRLRVRGDVDEFIAGHNAYVRERRQPGLSPFAPTDASFAFREGWDCAIRGYGPPPPAEPQQEAAIVTAFKVGDVEFCVGISAKAIVAQSWKIAGKAGLDLDKFVAWLREHEVPCVEPASHLEMSIR